MRIGKFEEPSTGHTLANGDLLYYQPATYDSYTKLLMHNDVETAETTAATGQTVTYVGTAATSAVEKKFGARSLLLDGDSDYVSVPDSADWDFGTGPFTVDFWVKYNNVGIGGYTHFGQNTLTDAHPSYRLDYYNEDGSLKELRFLSYNGASYDISFHCDFAPVVGIWYHIALVRVNSTDPWKIFIDGVSQTVVLGDGAWNVTMPNLDGVMLIGRARNLGNYLNGYIDEFRVSKGIARWTADFSATLPTTAYPNGQLGGGLLAGSPGWVILPIGTHGQTLKVATDKPGWSS